MAPTTCPLHRQQLSSSLSETDRAYSANTTAAEQSVFTHPPVFPAPPGTALLLGTRTAAGHAGAPAPSCARAPGNATCRCGSHLLILLLLETTVLHCILGNVVYTVVMTQGGTVRSNYPGGNPIGLVWYVCSSALARPQFGLSSALGLP